MMVTLGEDGVKTVEDFAGYAVDDLVGWKERKDGETKFFPGVLANHSVSRDEAEQMVMAARLKAGWITEDDLAAGRKQHGRGNSRCVTCARYRPEQPLEEMNERTCIVTRKSGAPDDLIRFVVGPGLCPRSRSEEKPSRPRLLGHRRPRCMSSGRPPRSCLRAR